MYMLKKIEIFNIFDENVKKKSKIYIKSLDKCKEICYNSCIN